MCSDLDEETIRRLIAPPPTESSHAPLGLYKYYFYSAAQAGQQNLGIQDVISAARRSEVLLQLEQLNNFTEDRNRNRLITSSEGTQLS